MRQLLPTPRDVVDLRAVYAFPGGQRWVRANMIASADGATALAGRSGGLGGPADQMIFRLVRQLADVILVGAGTARAEGYGPEPALAEFTELRAGLGQSAAPAIAVVSGRLDLDPRSPLFAPAASPTMIITCASAPAERRARLAAAAEIILAGGDRVDLGAAVDALHERGHQRISCEGGPAILAQLVAAQRLDELCLTVAPLLAGGSSARVLAGPLLQPSVTLTPESLLEDDGYLFLRYLCRPVGAAR